MYLANNLQDIINNNIMLVSTWSQLYTGRLRGAGNQKSVHWLQVFTQVDYSDTRSFLRSIQSCRRMVHPTIDWVVNKSAEVQQVNMDIPFSPSRSNLNMGLPSSNEYSSQTRANDHSNLRDSHSRPDSHCSSRHFQPRQKD